MDSFTLKIKYASLITDIETCINEANPKTDSEKHIADYLLSNIRECSDEIMRTLTKLGILLDK